MNVRVTIEVEGESAEVEQWLDRFALGSSSSRRVTASDVGSVEWTPELADRLVDRITDKARMAVDYMAMNAPEISFEELQHEMGLDGIRMGGVLASFGFAENAGIPRPYRVDRDRRRYYMEPDVADLIHAAVGRYLGEE